MWVVFFIMAMVMHVILMFVPNDLVQLTEILFGVYAVFIGLALVGCIITYAMAPIPLWVFGLFLAYLVLGYLTC